MAITPVNVKNSSSTVTPMAALQDASSNNVPMQSLDSNRPTYRASANFTPQPTAAVTLISVTGSASKTIRIKRITISGVSTALSSSTFQLLRTSVLGAGGTTVTPTVAKLDTTSATATATVSHYTATLKATGTAVGGPIDTFQQFTTTVTTPTVAYVEAQCVFPPKGAPIGQAIVLRGIADILEVQNVTPTNLAAGTVLAYTVEWEEDAS